MFDEEQELLMWFALVQKNISETAFIDEGRVYIRDLGIIEVPLFEAEAVLRLMNYAPHLLGNVYKAWEKGSETSIQLAFCQELYALQNEQTLDLVESISRADFFIELCEALQSLGAVQHDDFGIDELKAPVTIQHALFESLRK
jgi:hypothetical protein